jgi:glycerol-3-phosphate acyltransferase PlsY
LVICFRSGSGFRGGKGVATLLGIALALQWQVGVVYAVVWWRCWRSAVFRRWSGIVAGISAPVAAAFFGRFDLTILFLVLALMLLLKHRDNIGRLLAGTEPRIGKRSDQ